MNKYQNFVFENYVFDKATKTLTLNYSFDGELHFTESFTFDFEFSEYNNAALERALQKIFIVAGISYFKTYIAKNLVIKNLEVTKQEADFYSQTYQKGLGEFFYVNKLDPKTPILFNPGNKVIELIEFKTSGMLVALGGGKDSITSIDLLEKNGFTNIETWSLNHREQLEPLVQRIGKNHNYVSRQIDQKLLTPDLLPDSYNGHVPISAIFACVGTAVAILRGKQDVVMSNERSADESTLTYQGSEINHQYSKSSEFEQSYQQILNADFANSIRYYSLLRPICEVQIARYFAKHCFDKYKDVFSSCNSAFVHGQTKLSWDGKCSKCAFVYLILRPYVEESKLIKLMGGNLLENIELENTYKQLLGLTEEKPLECIGEINESRWAMQQAQKSINTLSKFSFEKVDDELIFKLTKSLLPKEIEKSVNFDEFLEQN